MNREHSSPSESTLLGAFAANFLGDAPRWYKFTILAFLLMNPVAMAVIGPFATGWLILLQFIFTLALALRCYPLQPGGLLALEAIALGLASPATVYQEAQTNFSIILLLMFMVAGIYFLRELLTFIFSKLFVKVKAKLALAFLFSAAAAFLSAFLDALTVIAVVITVAIALHGVYHRAISGLHPDPHDAEATAKRQADFAQFQAFLRSLVMHAAVGTALGGVCTLVGEPQNLLIGHIMGWDFQTFFIKSAPVSMPVLFAGLLTCLIVERLKIFGYGAELPASVREMIVQHDEAQQRQHTTGMTARLIVQGIVAVLLIVGLGLHVAEVGLIGLTVIVLATAFCGVIDEKKLGHAFEEALPFTALLVTFFAVVAVIHEQHLFAPIIDAVLAEDGRRQLALMYLANGALSAISDNVFVATVYISALKNAFDAGLVGADQFELLAVAINTGTNIPSVATPNGQAAFLFLLTSALAPVIRLGYGQMMWMAAPYAVVMTLTGFAAVCLWL